MSDPRPAVGPATERLYARLPEVYRDADAAQDTGASNYPLLRYLSLVLDQLTPVDTLAARFSLTPLDEREVTEDGNAFGVGRPWQRYGTADFGDDRYGDSDYADLVDPVRADAGWLPWLAQLVGVNIAGLTVAEQRERLLDPADSWAHGTRAAIVREARTQLGPSSYVDVRPHYQGDPFTMALVTKNDETYGVTSWGELKSIAPTWAALKTLGDFGNAEAGVVMLAAAAERPAGYRLTHVYLEDLD